VRSYRHRLLEAWDVAGRADAARRVRASLGSRIPVTTRAAASLFANLGELGSSDAGVGPRQRLRLWVGDEDLLGLQRLLAEDVAHGRMEPATLIATARGAGPLSPAQRLAMMEAAGEHGGIEAHLLRARLQLDLGRFDAALQSAERGLVLCGIAADDPARLRGQFLFLAARSHRGAGRLDPAIHLYAQAAEEARRPSPDGKIDGHALGACLAEQGRCHAERREWSQAVDRLEEALGCLRRGDADGQVHVDQIALVERNLARCHLEMHRARA
jgi:tetratricopeptide (TPR) repeat protein